MKRILVAATVLCLVSGTVLANGGDKKKCDKECCKKGKCKKGEKKEKDAKTAEVKTKA